MDPKAEAKSLFQVPTWVQEPKDLSPTLLLFHIISKKLDENGTAVTPAGAIWDAGAIRLAHYFPVPAPK